MALLPRCFLALGLLGLAWLGLSLPAPGKTGSIPPRTVTGSRLHDILLMGILAGGVVSECVLSQGSCMYLLRFPGEAQGLRPEAWWVLPSFLLVMFVVGLATIIRAEEGRTPPGRPTPGIPLWKRLLGWGALAVLALSCFALHSQARGTIEKTFKQDGWLIDRVCYPSQRQLYGLLEMYNMDHPQMIGLDGVPVEDVRILRSTVNSPELIAFIDGIPKACVLGLDPKGSGDYLVTCRTHGNAQQREDEWRDHGATEMMKRENTEALLRKVILGFALIAGLSGLLLGFRRMAAAGGDTPGHNVLEAAPWGLAVVGLLVAGMGWHLPGFFPSYANGRSLAAVSMILWIGLTLESALDREEPSGLAALLRECPWVIWALTGIHLVFPIYPGGSSAHEFRVQDALWSETISGHELTTAVALTAGAMALSGIAGRIDLTRMAGWRLLGSVLAFGTLIRFLLGSCYYGFYAY